MRMQYPLSLFVVWHPEFVPGKRIADNLYSIFCRDIDDPLSRGLGIQVYYRSAHSGEKPIPIDISRARRNAIILLVDQKYFNNEKYREYTQTLTKLVDENTRIYPVALFKHAYEIGCGLDKLQFLRAYQGDLNDEVNFAFSLSKIKTDLLNDCARLMMNIHPTWMDNRGENIPSPVTLFLSHAKKDGETTAKKFKAFVDANLKLNVFFDAMDIADGYDFEKQIESNIKSAAFVVFHTDAYSTREWCRIEVLIAKRNKCSIVVVHDIKEGEKRAFPYLGNTPTITIKQDDKKSFYQIVDLTLIQVLNNLYQHELLRSFQEWYQIDDAEFISITSPPELFNYLDIYKKKENAKNKLIILYPEPPLGAEELRILNEIDEDIKFITPILLSTIK